MPRWGVIEFSEIKKLNYPVLIFITSVLALGQVRMFLTALVLTHEKGLARGRCQALPDWNTPTD
jgi:hypothetical protein